MNERRLYQAFSGIGIGVMNKVELLLLGCSQSIGGGGAMDGALGGHGLGLASGGCSLSTADLSVSRDLCTAPGWVLPNCCQWVSQSSRAGGGPGWRMSRCQVAAPAPPLCSGQAAIVTRAHGSRPSSLLFVLEPVVGWRARRAALVQGKQALPAATLRRNSLKIGGEV